MKKLNLLILFMAVIILNGCKYKKQAEQLEAEKQDLVSHLDKSRLEMIDIRDKTSFTLNADIRKLEFATTHSAGSYEIKEGDSGTVVINITDPEKFWEGSSYLVIIL